MVYNAKICVKVSESEADNEQCREDIVNLINKYGGKNGTPNPRNFVVGIFKDKAAMKAFREKARLATKLWSDF